jgi:phosphatidylglycerophosphate synthase
MTKGSTTEVTARRVLATRHRRPARAAAAWLARHGVQPNTVSLASLVFAGAAAAAFAASPTRTAGWQAALLIVAGVCIQGRLLCNMLDGMLAVEEGLRSRTGDLYNELPDRLADVLILVGAGYGAGPYGPTLGWAAALVAVLTAYVRVFAGSLGLTQRFLGPMAKQHRMFALTLAAVAAAAEVMAGLPSRALAIGLAVIVAGSVITTWRRVQHLAREAAAR